MTTKQEMADALALASKQPTKGHADEMSPLTINLAKAEHVRILLALILHTAVVLGSVIAVIWSATATINTRLLSLEIHRDRDHEEFKTMAVDFKIIAIQVLRNQEGVKSLNDRVGRGGK
jgi:hypothetical protein